jgi:hypothetical protein
MVWTYRVTGAASQPSLIPASNVRRASRRSGLPLWLSESLQAGTGSDALDEIRHWRGVVNATVLLCQNAGVGRPVPVAAPYCRIATGGGTSVSELDTSELERIRARRRLRPAAPARVASSFQPGSNAEAGGCLCNVCHCRRLGGADCLSAGSCPKAGVEAHAA